MDILFISPDSSREVYQGLADRYSAIETPVWCLLLAGAMRGKYDVGILDPLAERLSDEQAWLRVSRLQPKLICFVVYGQNPNSGTTNMAGAERLAKYIRQRESIPIALIGSHPSALPDETLALGFADYVLPGDGLEALNKIMEGEKPGVIWSKPSQTEAFPSYAWDMIPSLDHYRAHVWHCNFDESKRSPFASIYTSLGCKFKCDFCMINMVNKSHPSQLDSSMSTGMRYFSTEFVLRELATLQKMGVKNVRISDEMFFFNKQHYIPILRGIVESGINLNLWAYARVDTVRPEHLGLFKTAGVNWLCLGIEASNQTIRREISKGSYEETDVRKVCKEIQDAGINLLANFIFGLPDENIESMEETLALAKEINAEHTNYYPCMALPGSPLHRQAVEKGVALPPDWSGYSFHSYDCVPLPTKHCTAAEVLAFRDSAWLSTSTDPRYLEMVDRKFGMADSIRRQAEVKLKRRLLEST